MSFLILLVITIIVRGLAAGIILGAEIMTLPLRKHFEISTYSKFIKALYKEIGVKIYALLTILGFLLTTIIFILSFSNGVSEITKWLTLISLLATSLGFVGTAGAFPAMTKLWRTSDEDVLTITNLLDRFTAGGLLSTIFHIIAFVVLVLALFYHNIR